ncbi:MAG: LacI family DNA-binding transcriptional regulator [Lachnospiraceae bacterium]|nr:LacI family DNA-binding transcriptional regulator [Lachnospiraceae bacterium]
MKNVTIKDVAKVAGVSYSTVSRALSGSPEISEETRSRILKICEEMNYTANTLARAMVMKSTQLIGVIVTNVSNPYISEIAYYVDGQARSRGYNIILCNSSKDPEQEKELFELLLGRQVDGIIVIPSSTDSYTALAPYLSRIPTVFLGENMRDLPESYVSVDNYRGAYMGVEYLYNLGHRKILYFGRRKGSNTHTLRANGYEDACKALGIEPQTWDSTFANTSIKHGYEMAKQLFSRKMDYTAIFSSTDTNALGILKAAEEKGIDIPGDLSLIGFDNIQTSALPRINLTTIEQPKKLLASVAVDSLLDRINNKQSGYSHQILYPSVVERSTCAPIPVRE